MSYSNDEELEDVVEYILTWMAMFGNVGLVLPELCKLDDILDDPDEEAWRYAKDNGYIERYTDDVSETRYRLTTKAFLLLDEVAKKGKQNGITGN